MLFQNNECHIILYKNVYLERTADHSICDEKIRYTSMIFLIHEFSHQRKTELNYVIQDEKLIFSYELSYPDEKIQNV